MNKLPILSAALLALCGCARHYVITLNNGLEIDARGKPKLVGGAYVFKDGVGNERHVPAGSVHEIAPASMMQSSDKDTTLTPPGK
jgi:hypothetical protein